MILKTLESMGSLHGYGLARRIEQVAEGTVALNQGGDILRYCGSSRRLDHARSGVSARPTAGRALLLDYRVRQAAIARGRSELA